MLDGEKGQGMYILAYDGRIRDQEQPDLQDSNGLKEQGRRNSESGVEVGCSKSYCCQKSRVIIPAVKALTLQLPLQALGA